MLPFSEIPNGLDSKPIMRGVENKSSIDESSAKVPTLEPWILASPATQNVFGTDRVAAVISADRRL